MKALLTCILIGIGFISCKKANNDASGRVCTTSFAYISIQVVDSADKYVHLSDYYSVVTSTGQIFRFNVDTFTIANYGYTVVSDAQLKSIAEKGTALSFIGYIDTVKVVDEKFNIGQDGCHILKLSGPEKVVVNK